MDKTVVAKGIGKLPEALDIRYRVFIEEQGFEMDHDQHDKDAYHVVIYKQGKPVATARAFLEDGKRHHIGRVAVLKEYRGQGLGKALLTALEGELAKTPVKKLYLGAQTHAQAFYEKLGYQKFGDVFLDEGSPHIHMEKTL